MDAKENDILFQLLDHLLDDTLISFGGGEYESFNSKENINKIIEELEKRFDIALKQ